MRVLIAGATGVIGRQAVPRLAAAGHDVIGLSRSPRPSAEAQHVAADLLDADALVTAMRSAAPDAVVHLATAIPGPVNPRRIARDMARTNRLRNEGTAGGAIFSFNHADDAATAIVAALERDLCGVLNVVDDDPAPLREWLPEMARMLDAPDPRHVPPWAARIAAGPFGVALMTELRGADNRRARRRLAWAPGHPSWREGLRGELARPALAA